MLLQWGWALLFVLSRKQTVRGNRVLQYDFDGNLIRVFKNAGDAAETLGKSTAWVSILCNADFILRYDR